MELCFELQCKYWLGNCRICLTVCIRYMGIWWLRLCIWFMVAISLSSMDRWIGKAGFVYADCVPRQGCDMALVSYRIAKGDTLNSVAKLFHTTLESLVYINAIPDASKIPADQDIYIPIPCMCIDSQLGFNVLYEVESGLTSLSDIVMKFHNLSKPEWIVSATPINDPKILFAGFVIKIPLNCSCGNPDINVNGPFVTYVTEENDSLPGISKRFAVEARLLQSLNPSVSWRNFTLHETIFFPANEGYHGPTIPPNSSQTETSHGKRNNLVIIGVSIGGGLVVILVAVLSFLYFYIYLPKRNQEGRVEQERTPSALLGSHVHSAEGTAKGLFWNRKTNYSLADVSKFI